MIEELRAQVVALTARVATLEEANARREFVELKELERRFGRITNEQFAQQVLERFGFPNAELDEVTGMVTVSVKEDKT